MRSMRERIAPALKAKAALEAIKGVPKDFPSEGERALTIRGGCS